MHRLNQFLLVALAIELASCNGRPAAEPPGLPLADLETKLLPFAQPLPPLQPGDWLSQHSEDGQTFFEYLRLKPRRRNSEPAKLYLLLLGDFSDAQREILAITQDYLSVFFQVPVVVLRELPLAVIPDAGRRLHPDWNTSQINTSYVLDQLLLPDRPSDALAFLCFTSSDLCSHATHNYVLGEARTWERVGVWSIHRNGDPSEGPNAFQQCLRRTLHIATHETGHILAFKHCTAFQCNMNGANSVAETDRHPLHLCPVCLRKLLWNFEIDPNAYLTALESFYRQQGFAHDADWCAKASHLMK